MEHYKILIIDGNTAVFEITTTTTNETLAKNSTPAAVAGDKTKGSKSFYERSPGKQPAFNRLAAALQG